MFIFFVWIFLALIVGAIGKNKTIGFAGGFFLSILLSPLIGLIIVLVSKNKILVVETKVIRCDGCRKVIKGEYIRITPKGMKDIYDYCNIECRNEYHPNYMKEKGIEWSPSVENETKE